MRKVILSIVTSEKTWRRTETLGLKNDIEAARENFDLAIVINGKSDEAREFFGQFEPEYYFERENKGYDPAAVEFLFKNIPLYDITIILHDDHKFEDPAWFEKLVKFTASEKEIDIWGNILPITANGEFLDYLERRGFDFETNPLEFSVLQGMAGIFSKNAIEKLKSIEFNFEQTDDKKIAEFGEWIFSLAIEESGLKTKLINDKAFDFLKHSENNEKNYYYWNGFFEFSRGNFEQAEFYLKTYLFDFGAENNADWFLYAMLAKTAFFLNKFEEALDFAAEVKARGFGHPQIDAIEQKAREMLNV